VFIVPKIYRDFDITLFDQFNQLFVFGIVHLLPFASTDSLAELKQALLQNGDMIFDKFILG
jgi:hypothetical protein